MKATATIFREAIEAALAAAERAGATAIEINAGRLHRAVGGYPGPSHRMPLCCAVMRQLMEDGDAVVAEPPKGAGASLTVRYVLPRRSRLQRRG